MSDTTHDFGASMRPERIGSGNSPTQTHTSTQESSFNEARAHWLGKFVAATINTTIDIVASMRPERIGSGNRESYDLDEAAYMLMLQ